MIRRLPRVVLVPVILALLPAGTSGATAREYLETALGGPKVPFSGRQHTEVHMDTGPSSADVLVQGDGRGRVRREYRSGSAAGMVILQSGRVMWQRIPGEDWVKLPETSEKSTPAAQAVLRNYSVTVSSPATLLGRRVVPIRVQAKRPYNPSRRLWLDTATAVILRDDLYAPDGRLRSSTRFTAFSPGPQPASLFLAPASATAAGLFGPASFRPLGSAAAVIKETGLAVPRPAYVPPGYRAVMVGVFTTGSGRSRPGVRYSDGLSAFTILERGRGPGGARGGRGRGPGGGMGGRGRGRGPGAGLGFGGGMAGDLSTQATRQRSLVMINRTKASYTLVGDLALDELLKVARSLP